MNKVYIHGITKQDNVYKKFKKNTENVFVFVDKPEESDFIILMYYSKQLPVNVLQTLSLSNKEDNFKLDINDPIMHADMFSTSTYSFYNLFNEYVKLLKYGKKIILTGQKLCSFSILMHNVSFSLIKTQESEMSSKHTLKYLTANQFDTDSAHLTYIPKKFRDVNEDGSNYIYSGHNILLNPKHSSLKENEYLILSYADGITNQVIKSTNTENKIEKLDPEDDVASFYVKNTKTLFILDNILEPAVFINENAEYLIGGNLDYLYELISIIDEIK